MKTSAIEPGEKVIDSRDVIERIDELKELMADYENDLEIWKENQETETGPKTEPRLDDYLDDDEQEELANLKALADEADGSPDWIHGDTLIHDDYFTEYAIEMLKDIGDLPANIPWYVVIDEEATAENIRTDYTSVSFGSETYYIRS